MQHWCSSLLSSSKKSHKHKGHTGVGWRYRKDWCRTSLQKLIEPLWQDRIKWTRKTVKEARQTPTAAEPAQGCCCWWWCYCKLVSGIHLLTTAFRFLLCILNTSWKQPFCLFTTDLIYMLHSCHQRLSVSTQKHMETWHCLATKHACPLTLQHMLPAFCSSIMTAMKMSLISMFFQ